MPLQAQRARGVLGELLRESARVPENVVVRDMERVARDAARSRAFREAVDAEIREAGKVEKLSRAEAVLQRLQRFTSKLDPSIHEGLKEIDQGSRETALVLARGGESIQRAIPDIATRSRFLQEGGAEAAVAIGALGDDAAKEAVRLDQAIRAGSLTVREGQTAVGLADFGRVMSQGGEASMAFWKTYVKPHWKIWLGTGALAAYLAAPESFQGAAGQLTEVGFQRLTELAGAVGAAAIRGVGKGSEKAARSVWTAIYETYFTGESGLFAIAGSGFFLLLASEDSSRHQFGFSRSPCGRKQSRWADLAMWPGRGANQAMATGNNGNNDARKVYRFGLYGGRSSGKTCILTAMGMSRRQNPLGYACKWIQETPDHPLPAGDESVWKTEDPYHLGVRWLRQARNKLEGGGVPEPNPERGLLALRFEFAMPDRGRLRIELIDYSGELITRTSAQLASDLRAHMQVCDGMLLLGEAHRDNRSLAPLASDLENLKEAISILFAERDDRPQQDWPIAFLLNKWDRQGQIDFESPEHEDSRLQTFLENLDVPHVSLIQMVTNVVKPENIKLFPVSAFGESEILPSGEEVPRRNGPLLQSFRLEDPFVWLAERRDQLDVRAYATESGRCWWCAFWQLLVGQSPRHADPTVARSRGFWWRSLRGVSPLLALIEGHRMARRLPGGSSLSDRVKHQSGRLWLKLVSQIAALLLVILLIEAGWDVTQINRIRSDVRSAVASEQQLKDD